MTKFQEVHQDILLTHDNYKDIMLLIKLGEFNEMSEVVNEAVRVYANVLLKGAKQ